MDLSLLPIRVNGFTTEQHCPYTVRNKNVNRRIHMVLKINYHIQSFDFQSGPLVTTMVVVYRPVNLMRKKSPLSDVNP